MVSGYEIRQAGGLAQGCNIILRSQAGRQVYTLNPDLLLKLEFPSNPELLSVVRGAMERLTERMGFSERECRSVTRAVDEAVTNIIRHAYRGQPNQPIVLTCYRRLSKAVGSELAQGLEIVLEDQGEPPDPGRLRGRSLDEIKPGGLGLHYIRESMDVVEFSRSGGTNQLRLVRCLRPENPIQDS
ncbi:MAG: ATP-binding protein [Candidatus Acidiferrum sp.]